MANIDDALKNTKIIITRTSSDMTIHVTCKYCGKGNKFLVPVYDTKCRGCGEELLPEEGVGE